MKKGIVLAVMAIILASFAVAQEAGSESVMSGPTLFALDDFALESNKAQERIVSKGDQMTFEMFGQTHALFIKDLINDNIKIVLFPNIQDGSGSKGAGSLPIKIGQALAIDINKDDRKDMLVNLYKINDDGTAVVIIRDVRDAPRETDETPIPTGLPVGVVPSEDNNKHYKNSFLVLGLVIAALFGLLVARRFRGKGNTEESKAEESTKEPSLD
ncbi:MAG: hypothetical protein V1906_00280 [Candidatus Woesearchaeota archaeon]